MGSQNISYVSTNDTGEPTSSSIAPITNTMPFDAAHLAAPGENLRLRTEVIRNELQDDKYLHDADREMVLFGGGTISWGGTLGTNATFTTTANLILRPLLSPYTCTAATVSFGVPGYNQIIISTQTANYTNLSAVTKYPPRAYGRWGDATYLGANKITVQTQTGGSASVTFGGTWNNELTISFVDGVTQAGSGVGTLIYLLNHNATFVDLGLVASLGPGSTGSNTLTGSSGAHPAVIAQTFMAGAADAEQHFVTPAGFVNFFATNPTLNTGDVIAIRYDSLVSASGGGRRQSIDQVPENSGASTPSGSGANCDSNLFLLSANAGYLPYALPLCRVMEVTGNLHFVDGTEVLNGTPRILGGSSGSLVSYAGGPNWTDGTTNPASNVQAQLSKIVSDLIATSATTGTTPYGWGKISAAVTSAFADGWTTTGTRIDSVVNNIITALAGTGTGTVSGTTDGAARIGSSAITGNTHTNPSSGSVKSQLIALAAAIDALKDLLTSPSGAANVDGSAITTTGSHANISAGTLQAMLAALAQVVDTEFTTRASADSTLTTNLANEVTARGTGDSTIVTNLGLPTGDMSVGAAAYTTTNTTTGSSVLGAGTVHTQLHSLADGLLTEATNRTALAQHTGYTVLNFGCNSFSDGNLHCLTPSNNSAAFSIVFKSGYNFIMRGILISITGPSITAMGTTNTQPTVATAPLAIGLYTACSPTSTYAAGTIVYDIFQNGVGSTGVNLVIPTSNSVTGDTSTATLSGYTAVVIQGMSSHTPTATTTSGGNVLVTIWGSYA